LLPLKADNQQGVQRRNGEVREDYSVTVPERRPTKPEKTSGSALVHQLIAKNNKSN
jgi:hypothetical protein